MSDWTHAICVPCWTARNPDKRPVQTPPDKLEVCCWCGGVTGQGIYLREDPATLRCHGEHAALYSEAKLLEFLLQAIKDGRIGTPEKSLAMQEYATEAAQIFDALYVQVFVWEPEATIGDFLADIPEPLRPAYAEELSARLGVHAPASATILDVARALRAKAKAKAGQC